MTSPAWQECADGTALATCSYCGRQDRMTEDATGTWDFRYHPSHADPIVAICPECVRKWRGANHRQRSPLVYGRLPDDLP